MQEVKEICERMLVEPAPPMTSPDDLLEFARTTQRRHRARIGIGLAAAATLAATAAVPLLGWPSNPNRVEQAVATPPSSSSPGQQVHDVSQLLVDPPFVVRQAPGRILLVSGTERVIPPTSDLCEVRVFPLKMELDDGTCQTITINGEPIRTGTYRATDPAHGSYEIQFAVRYIDGKAVVIVQMPQIPADPAQTPTPLLTMQQLAEAVLTVRF